MASDQLLYVGQKAFINDDDRVLVVMDPRLGLDFPGGKIQAGELDFDESLKREVREETSLEIKVGDPFFRWHVPDLRAAGKRIYLIGFFCFYVSGEVVLSDEHSEYLWVDRHTYRELDDGSGFFRALEVYFSHIIL